VVWEPHFHVHDSLPSLPAVSGSNPRGLGDYQSDPISGKATLGVGHPVLDETGQVQAVVFAALDLTWLNRLAAEAPSGSRLSPGGFGCRLST
jgi:hypothetical protein